MRTRLRHEQSKLSSKPGQLALSGDPNTVDVWISQVRPIAAEEVPNLEGLPPSVSGVHAQKLRGSSRRLQHVACRVAVRTIVGAYLSVEPASVELTVRCQHCGKLHGKPRLVAAGGLDFSISHTHEGWSALAVAVDREVGVDIETGTRVADIAGLEGGVLAPEERGGLVRSARHLLKVWTRKEALLKATGHGLAVPPASVCLQERRTGVWQVARSAHLADPSRWTIIDLRLPAGIVGAIAVCGGSSRPVVRSLPEWRRLDDGTSRKKGDLLPELLGLVPFTPGRQEVGLPIRRWRS